MGLNITGKVVRKFLQQPGPGAEPGVESACVVLNVNGTEVTFNVPVAQEVNYVLGNTVTFNQA
jgi:hypothetical protein